MPGLNGVFNTILAWMGLAVVITLHIVYVMEAQNIAKIRSIVTLVYYSLMGVWFFGIMISLFHRTTGLTGV